MSSWKGRGGRGEGRRAPRRGPSAGARTLASATNCRRRIRARLSGARPTLSAPECVLMDDPAYCGGASWRGDGRSGCRGDDAIVGAREEAAGAVGACARPRTEARQCRAWRRPPPSPNHYQHSHRQGVPGAAPPSAERWAASSAASAAQQRSEALMHGGAATRGCRVRNALRSRSRRPCVELLPSAC